MTIKMKNEFFEQVEKVMSDLENESSEAKLGKKIKIKEEKVEGGTDLSVERLGKTMDGNNNQQMNFGSSAPNSADQRNCIPMWPLLLPHDHYCPNSIEDFQQVRDYNFKQLQKRNVELFWHQQLYDIQNSSASNKSQHQLPLARIKRIMKSDGDVKMISSETPILFSKACELFIMELTLRAWLQTEECKRRTLQRCDIAKAIREDELLDFLVDVVPKDDNYHYHYPNHSQEEEATADSHQTDQPHVFAAPEPQNLPETSIGRTPQDITSMIEQVPQQYMIFDSPTPPSIEPLFKFPSSEQK